MPRKSKGTMVSGSWTGLGPARMLDRRFLGATPIHRCPRNDWTFAMLYRWEFSAAMIFHMCWATRTRIRILKKFSRIMDENKDWPHEIWFERCQFATTLLTIFGSSRMWTFIVYVSDAVEKNRMVAFPWVNFMKSKIRHLPFGSALFSHPGRAQCSATTGNTTTIPTISNCWKKIKKKICEGQILRKLMNMPRASVTPKI